MNEIIESFSSSTWTAIDGLVTLLTLGVVAFNAWQNQKNKKLENEKINIFLEVENKKYLLNLDIPRKKISRSEVQGLLSAFQIDSGKRYSIDYLSEINFLDDVFKIQNNEISELNIKLTNTEFEVFNLNKMLEQ